MDSPIAFTLFTSLPSELRIKIWKYSLPEPRVVPVRYNRAAKQYTSTTAPPALLHVCSESRSLFLSTYTKFVLSPKYDSAVFVDFERDHIFFDNLDCSPEGDLSLDLAKSPHRDRILSCAIDSQVWEILRVFKYDSLSEVKLMPNLRTIALVMPKDHDRGFHQRRVDEDGRENIFVEIDSATVGSEIRHVSLYVEGLRWELKHALEKHWTGNPPHVQMWLW
jgi:hypothetical protein